MHLQAIEEAKKRLELDEQDRKKMVHRQQKAPFYIGVTLFPIGVDTRAKEEIQDGLPEEEKGRQVD